MVMLKSFQYFYGRKRIKMFLMTDQPPRKRTTGEQLKTHVDKYARVLLCGDTILTRRLDLRETGPFAGIRTVLESADVRFTNLETPFNGYAGPPNANEIIHLSTSPEMAQILAELGFNLCSAANNHALDYGTEGLVRTMSVLKAAKVLFTGIGH